MRNSTARKRQFSQETSQTHAHCVGARSVTGGPVRGRGPSRASAELPHVARSS